MKIEQMNMWIDKHDLLLNRIAIVNQIHGCNYDYSYGNPCTVRFCRGWYTCDYFGNRLCAWRVYDFPSLDVAYDRVDSLADTLWLVRRAGCLRVKNVCR